MVPPGGPAAIYGFLFQILRTAEWALKIDLRAPQKDVNDVTIVAEPPGGDVDVRFPLRRVVQQFKVRDEGTWSLADIVDKTLPDLYQSKTSFTHKTAASSRRRLPRSYGCLSTHQRRHQQRRSRRTRVRNPVGDATQPTELAALLNLFAAVVP